MQLSPRLAARPLRLLPPLASATSGPRRHSVAYLIKPQAPPRPGATPPDPARPHAPPPSRPGGGGPTSRPTRPPPELPRARLRSLSAVLGRSSRKAAVAVKITRSEDYAGCPSFGNFSETSVSTFGGFRESSRSPTPAPSKDTDFPTTQTVCLWPPLEIRPTPRRPCPSGQSLPTILTVRAFGSFRRFPALAHRPSRD